MDPRYAEIRKTTLDVFSTYSPIEGSEITSISPTGLYKLRILTYGPDQKPAWYYSRGIVTRNSDGYVIADVIRNYGHFWYTWLEHPNGNEYLLCGEDYQGYCVVNLSQESYQVYFPEEGYRGTGFCWTAVYPSPDNLVLAVHGCIWASPYDLVFYDFRTPDNLPYRELGRTSDVLDTYRWLDNQTFQIEREITLRKEDGVLYNDLSEAEQDKIDRGETEAEYQTIKVQITKPALDPPI